ncbi:hypothetical protein PInf_023813 [Phytophthora infestans]|nr:hypothetical protein PInf_023813 [Phytophthora infestans]
MQLRRARRAIAAFTRRVHCANAYRYRKQGEFMRVCYQRALETGPGYKVVEMSKLGDKSLNEVKRQALLVASQKDDAVETTVPSLFPRKWPHLPFRSPLEWVNDTDAAIEFISRLAELPETSLIYEPIDASKFAAEAAEFLKLTASERTPAVSDAVFAGLLGLFAMGVQLQSFTLLTKAALQFIELGQATYLRDADGGPYRPELQKLLDLYYSRLAQHVAEPILAATFPRDLSAQWKVCSYQPSTSDAIATDGLYLYIFGRSGLLKIGTGHGTTVRDFVYAHNKEYVRSRDAERSWLCCIGDALYCRTIVMPGHRVDRIQTYDLQNVQELVLAPNRALIGKGTTESSVYAMVTDGVDLFTVRCIDAYKKLSSKTSSSRKHRSRSHKSRKSTPVSEIVNAVLSKSDSGPKSPLQSPEAVSISVGDRVIRGPDWKWSNQDGDNGSPGTVERISTWGGVKGSGVTVRWDKNQRVNTYRWGAEGCYDLYIVLEHDGFLEQKPLPNARSSGQVKGGEGAVNASRENELEPLPRHQFVLYRHKVDIITSIMKLEEPDIDLFLDLTPSRDKYKRGTSGSSEAQGGVETLSALHSHLVTLCTSQTSWMCDGGMSNCFGDNATQRYRCTLGCDFDLCESCLFATVIDKPSMNDGPVASDFDASTETAVSEGIDPFSTVDVSLFAESARGVSLKKKVGDKKKQKQQTEEQMLCVVSPPGLYTASEEHSDKAKRAASSSDASWFFSLENGSLLADKPVLLKGIPAGSPTCVDMRRKRILVFSGYLNCLEEYVDHVQQSRQALKQPEPDCATLADTGKLIISQLAQLMRKRAALPAYKHPRAGLQDILFQTGREPAPPASDKPSDHKDGDLSTKPKNRRIKNICARLKELDRLPAKDLPGYIIPFCVDFEDEGVLQILRAINRYCKMLPFKGDGDDGDGPTRLTAVYRLVADLLRILAETVQEYEFVGVTMKIDASDDATQELFKDTECELKDISGRLYSGQVSGQASEDAATQREHVIGCGSDSEDTMPELPESYFAILLEPHDFLVLQTKRDCGVDLLRRLLYSPMDDGRIAIADFLPTEADDFARFLEVLLALSKLESRSSTHREKWVLKVDGLPFQTPRSTMPPFLEDIKSWRHHIRTITHSPYFAVLCTFLVLACYISSSTHAVGPPEKLISCSLRLDLLGIKLTGFPTQTLALAKMEAVSLGHIREETGRLEGLPWKFVDDVVNHAERGDVFFSTLSKYHLTARWNEALQEAAAVLLVRSKHHLIEAWMAGVENRTVLSNDIENALFHRIAVELGKLERWMLRQVQLVSEWHYLCIDEVSLDELMERYADNLDRLSELCHLKSVPFKNSDVTSCVKSIHELLVKDIAVKHEKDEDAHSQPTVSISALEECSTAHSARLESRLAGVGYCEKAFADLKNEDMAQFFVGRALYAVPSSNVVQDDAILSGCALANPRLLAKTMAS